MKTKSWSFSKYKGSTHNRRLAELGVLDAGRQNVVKRKA